MTLSSHRIVSVKTLSPRQIELADIYDGIWKRLDFELSHLWQRSIFLTAFLLACFTGYGGLVVTVVSAEHLKIPYGLANGVAFGICIIGVVLSVLWILMAKGSKAWYEQYESAMNSFCEKFSGDSDFCARKASQYVGFDINSTGDRYTCARTATILDCNGGSYSVSKVNIAIGHVSLCVWSLLLIAHFAISCLLHFPFVAFVHLLRLLTHPVALLAELLLFALIFRHYIINYLVSGTLEDSK